MHLTKDSLNSLLKNPPILSAFIQNTHFPLRKLILLQISYKTLFEYAYLFAYLEQFLTKSTNIHIQEAKSIPIHFLNTITFHILINGFPFSYMIVLNVKATNTLI